MFNVVSHQWYANWSYFEILTYTSHNCQLIVYILPRIRERGNIYSLLWEYSHDGSLCGCLFSRWLSRAPPTRQQERRCYRILLHTFIQSCFFFFIYLPCFYISLVYISPLFLYLPCFYISLVYISLVFISPLFISLPCFYLPCFYISPTNSNPLSNNNPPSNPGLSLFYTLSSHPHTAGHATSPGTQLQLIRAAGANLHQIGFTCILVHLCSTQDVCVLYEEVRCKSYDLAAVPGAFRTAATPAPHRWSITLRQKSTFHTEHNWYTYDIWPHSDWQNTQNSHEFMTDEVLALRGEVDKGSYP
jgi:hypothetical protein